MKKLMLGAPLLLCVSGLALAEAPIESARRKDDCAAACGAKDATRAKTVARTLSGERLAATRVYCDAQGVHLP